MATNPEEARKNHEAELAAALLVLGARYNLPALIRRAKAKPRPFHQIEPTEALRSAMANPYLQIVRAWAGERDALVAAYTLARATGDAATITRQVAASAARVDAVVAAQEARIPGTVATLEQWHRKQWNARIRAATGIDPKLFTGAAEVASEASSAIAWGRQLAADVSRQVRSQIEGSLLAAHAARETPEQAGAAIARAVTKARRRSLGIGVEQTNRTSRGFDRERRRAAGLTRFRWRHSPHVRVPRKDHVARDGRVYSQSNAPNDRAGTLYGCQCWEEPLLD